MNRTLHIVFELNGEETEVPIPDGSVTVGRQDGADIVIADKSISKVHARLTVEGETVRLATADEISNCSRVGRTRSHSLDRIVGIGRSADKLQEELLTLARNEAGTMGGDTIVPESLIEEGEQAFGVYSCS